MIEEVLQAVQTKTLPQMKKVALYFQEKLGWWVILLSFLLIMKTHFEDT